MKGTTTQQINISLDLPLTIEVERFPAEPSAGIPNPYFEIKNITLDGHAFPDAMFDHWFLWRIERILQDVNL